MFKNMIVNKASVLTPEPLMWNVLKAHNRIILKKYRSEGEGDRYVRE